MVAPLSYPRCERIYQCKADREIIAGMVRIHSLVLIKMLYTAQQLNNNNMAEFKDYENAYLTIDYVNFTVVPLVYEVLVDSYGIAEEDYNGYIDDHIHEVIDGLEEVIYNYQARKICDAFELDPFGESEWTGEQNTSWNQMVYELIYCKVQDKYHEQFEQLR